jgi:putative glutathione S-transferase
VTATASAIDAAAWGEFRTTSDTRPAFRTRITADGAGVTLPAEPGRFHVYAAGTSPASHRLELIRLLGGLEDVVSVSHVDGLRDARGWAFREPTGPDPVNGFTLLREAYTATVPGYAGKVRVPVLWDRVAGRIASDDAVAIGIDLATQFGATPSLYPVQLAGEIERVSATVTSSFGDRVATAAVQPEAAAGVRQALRRLDRHLADHPYLVGDVLTDADLRLWPALVRYDVGSNAHRTLGPALSSHPQLWAYARRLYDRPEFRATTDFGAFAAPFSELGAWTS